mgnify:CR=1 FL=1
MVRETKELQRPSTRNEQRRSRIWFGTVAMVAGIVGLAGCGVAPPLGAGGPGTGIDTTLGTLSGGSLAVDSQRSIAGFTSQDLAQTGYALNIPQQLAFVPSMIREPRRHGIQLVNEFPQWPIVVENGILRSTITGPSPEDTGAVHYHHSLYDVYVGMAVAVDPGFANAITLIMRHHVRPATYGTRPHCYVGCRLNTALNRIEAFEDIGGTIHLRGYRPIHSYAGVLEGIAYKSNFGCYYNGQFTGATYSKQFQENNERNALYGITGQAFRAARAVVVNLFEASRRTEIPWFVDKFDRNQFGSIGSNYMTTPNAAPLVSNGMLRMVGFGTQALVWIEGTADMRSQDIRADIEVGTFGQAGVIGHYVPGRGGYAAFVDCNGTCSIRAGYLDANNLFTTAQSVPFMGPDYPSIGFGFQGRARVRMTVVRNQSGNFQVNVYLNEQLALSFRPARPWENGHAGVYVGNDGAVDELTLADHSQ